MVCHCDSGWVCEAHPDRPWPHDACPGPGMQCPARDCSWWRGTPPAAIGLDRWDTVIASTRMFRVVQPWGADKAREATLISEHPTAAEAFAEIDRLSAEMVCTG